MEKMNKANVLSIEKIAKIIQDKFHLPVHKDEIMQAIPSDKLSVK